jgi:hypothetical protein
LELAASEWTFGWSALVAIGTLSLAFFTWRAVRRSGQQIALSRREVTAIETQTQALVDQARAVGELLRCEVPGVGELALTHVFFTPL